MSLAIRLACCVASVWAACATAQAPAPLPPLQLSAGGPAPERIGAWGGALAVGEAVVLEGKAQDLTRNATVNAFELRFDGVPEGAVPAIVVRSPNGNASIWEWSPGWLPDQGVYLVGFAEFVPLEGWGADFRRADSVAFAVLDAPKSPAGISAEIKGAATLRATKSAALIDVDGDNEVNPGDQLSYTINITNLGAQNANSCSFSDFLDPDTTLNVGTVFVTDPASFVFSGNSGGDTFVQVNIPEVGVAPCQPQLVAITFVATVSDPFPGGDTEVCNQGQATSPDSPTASTDDPATGTQGDPTCKVVVSGASGPHTADQDGNNKISLSELLRVIQFYNFGAYSCDPLLNSEDGYLPGAGDESCTPHSSDYNSQNWAINLSELLRLIQFYNSGGYYPCAEGEDGYCAGIGP